MPAQAMITHLSKAETQKMISDLKAQELLEMSDTDGTILLICQMDGLNHVEGATEALQKICDADSMKTQAAVAAAEAENPTPPEDKDGKPKTKKD